MVGALGITVIGCAYRQTNGPVVPGHVPSQAEQARVAPVEAAQDTVGNDPHWIKPGAAITLPASAEYPNANGSVGFLAAGVTETAGHPFFTPLGENGRACVTCHQPSDAMSVSVETVQRRWRLTNGRDSLFAAVDGSNCPSLPQGERASHSLLLDHGLFRIFLPWPGRSADGKPVEPEFDIEVVRDPSGCNLDPVYGLKSANPMISVFRRPRPVGNLKYVTWALPALVNIKSGLLMDRDPETGQQVGQNIMSDSRQPTLRTQAVEASLVHLQARTAPSRETLSRLVEFQLGIYFAQSRGKQVNYTAPGAPPALGPAALAGGKPGVLGDNLYNSVFLDFDAWRTKAPKDKKSVTAFKQSVARGSDLFLKRTFWIRDSANLNSIGLGNPIKRSCATCHNSQMTGMDNGPGWIDLGTTTQPTAPDMPHLPLFKLTCHAKARPHPYLGRVVFTHDPGRALISGKCADIGSITLQQMRGLSARAPYFSNGSAKTIEAIVDYYDTRYKIGYTKQERRDLVNFLSAL